MRNLYQKALNGKELQKEELQSLYLESPLSNLMFIANEIRKQKHPNNRVSWQIDRNINITNVCISSCSFCNFHCKLSEKEKNYTETIESYRKKIAELLEMGGDQVLLQGGLHPHYGLNFYTDLFRTLKKDFPKVKLHALGPPEIAHIAKIDKLSYREVLETLVEAGLESLPGAGAEILSQRVRKIISPGKPDVQAWLDVMRIAHQMNLPTSATMMYGHLETIEERIEHLLLLRSLQNERPNGTYGFLAFICWPVYLQETKLAQDYIIAPSTASEYLRLLAISRIALTNILNIQASWLTVGKDTAQLALYGGANDFGSIMIEENVVSSAGANHQFDSEGIQAAIREAGFEPWLRNQCYEERSRSHFGEIK